MDSGIRGKVDVIIPAYQAEAFIRRAMDSVRLQGETVNQVFIVDNASTDGTSDVVQRYIAEHGLAHWKLMHEARKGAPAARNHPLACARQGIHSASLIKKIFILNCLLAWNEY